MPKNKKKLVSHFSFLLIALGTIAIGLLLIKIVSVPKNEQSAKAAGKDLYGIAGGDVINSTSSSQLAQQLDGYTAVGAQWVRFDFSWRTIQAGGKTSYDWTNYDAAVTAATARGIKVLGIVDLTPAWEVGADCTDTSYCPPKSAADFAGFGAALAAHFGPMGVHTWEIWNEPNAGNGKWLRFSLPAYTALLKAAYPAMKQADPHAFILTGGTAPSVTDAYDYSPTDFLTGIYQNGGKNYFDAVAHHPYCYGNAVCPPTSADGSAWAQLQDTTPSLRSIMVTNGDGTKQIWGTEFGAPTGGGTADFALPITEAQQAQMVTTAYTLWNSYSWAGPLFWYTYQDPCTTPTSIECFFGLVRPDASLKPAYTAYKNMSSNSIAPTDAISLPPTTTSTLSPTISNASPTSFSITLCLHGLGNCGDNAGTLGGNTNPLHAQKNSILTLFDSTNQQVSQTKGTLIYSPSAKNFQATVSANIPSGQYLATVKIDAFLQKKIPGIISVVSGKVNILPPVSLVTGDINNDDQLDILDYNLLIACYGSKEDTNTCTAQISDESPGADITDDGVVNEADYNQLLRELSVQKGE